MEVAEEGPTNTQNYFHTFACVCPVARNVKGARLLDIISQDPHSRAGAPRTNTILKREMARKSTQSKIN